MTKKLIIVTRSRNYVRTTKCSLDDAEAAQLEEQLRLRERMDDAYAHDLEAFDFLPDDRMNVEAEDEAG